MTSKAPNAQEGIAHAVTDLGEQTAVLIRQELEAVKDEMTAKVTQWLPAAGLLGLAAGSGVFAGASVYRLVTRTLDKMFGPVAASLVAGAGFSAVAVVAGKRGLVIARALPAPVPAETARVTGAAIDRAVQAHTRAD